MIEREFRFNVVRAEWLALTPIAIGRPTKDFSMPDYSFSYGVIFHVSPGVVRVLTVRYRSGHSSAAVQVDDVHLKTPETVIPVVPFTILSGYQAGEWINGAKEFYRSYRDNLNRVRGVMW